MGYEPKMLSDTEVEKERRSVKRVVVVLVVAAAVLMIGLFAMAALFPFFPSQVASSAAWLPPGAKIVSAKQSAPGGSFNLVFKLPKTKTPKAWMHEIMGRNMFGAKVKSIAGGQGMETRISAREYQTIVYGTDETYRFDRHIP